MYCPKCGENKQANNMHCEKCQFNFHEIIKNTSAQKNFLSESRNFSQKKIKIVLMIAFAVVFVLFLINSTLFATVEITVPAGYHEGYDDHDLREHARELNYRGAVRNEDGTVTITMTKRRHRDRLKELSNMIEDYFTDLVETPDAPYIKGISQKNNYSQITIEVERNGYESQLFDGTHFAVAMLGILYQNYKENPQDVNVIVKDIETGVEILSYNP